MSARTGYGLRIAGSDLRSALATWVESALLHRVIITLVVLNAVILGLETIPGVMAYGGTVLVLLDRVILAVFVVELLLKLTGHGLRFFRNGWNVFDLVVVGLALIPASSALSVLRALRVLRILRLISAVAKMRMLVESLVRSLPGMGSIVLLLLIFFYVFAVVATKLFGADFPQWFGTLWGSGFSLFQIMTLEGWVDIAREVMAKYPAAWLFFVVFILISTFTALNLFIGLIVKSMEDPAASSRNAGLQVSQELVAIRKEIAAVRAALPPRPPHRAGLPSAVLGADARKSCGVCGAWPR